jgi:hypothetical protein
MSGRQDSDDLELGVERVRIPAKSRQPEIVTLLDTRDLALVHSRNVGDLVLGLVRCLAQGAQRQLAIFAQAAPEEPGFHHVDLRQLIE